MVASPAAGQAPTAPAVVQPPPGHPRFPLIDSLRAIAALCVLLAHVSFVSRASFESVAGPILSQLIIGVPIFFAISGFVLYRPFVAARWSGAPAPSPLRYGWRRFLRIVPAYWLALTLLAIYPGLAGVFGERWWVYYGFLQLYDSSTVLSGMLQAWSLCVEVTFYAILPLYALALRRITRAMPANRALRTELLALAGLYLLTQAFRGLAHALDEVIWLQTLPATFDWFVMGMVVAVWSVALGAGHGRTALARVVEKRPGLIWGLAATLFLVLCLTVDLPRGLVGYSTFERTIQHTVFGFVALLVLLPAAIGDHRTGWPRRLLRTGVLAWLGLISYGIFLYNLSVAYALDDRGLTDWLGDGQFLLLTGGTLAISVAVASASYYCVEAPLLRLKDRPFRAGRGGRRPRATEVRAQE